MAKVDSNQAKWLVRVAGSAPVLEVMALPLGTEEGGGLVEDQGEWVAKEKKKQARLEAVQTKLNEKKRQIHELLAIKVTVIENGESKEVPFFGNSAIWDPQNEFDTGHHIPNVDPESLTPDRMRRIKDGMKQITELKDLISGTIRPEDFPVIYQEHKTDGKSIQEIAEERLVSEETIQRVILRQQAREEGSDKAITEQVGVPGDVQKTIRKRFHQEMQEQKEEFPDKDPESLAAPLRKKYIAEFASTYPKLTDSYLQELLKGDLDSLDPITDPAFDDMEMRREFFDPLKRERILPDNLIIDKYNETVQQFGGASKYYQKRLEEESEKMEENAETLAAIKKAGKVIKSLGKAAGDIAGVVKELAEKGSNLADNAELAGKIITTIQAVGMLGCATAEAVLKKSSEGVIDKVADVLEAGLKFQFDTKTSSAIKTAFLTGARAAEFANLLVQGDVNGAINKLAEGIEGGFSLTGDDNLGRVGKAIGFAMKSYVNIQTIRDALKKDPPNIEVITKVIANATASACKAILSDPALQDNSEKVKKARKEGEEETEQKKKDDLVEDARSELDSSVSETLEPLEESFEESGQALKEARAALKEMLAHPKTPEQIQAMQELIEKKNREAFQAELEEERLKVSQDPNYAFVDAVRQGLAEPPPGGDEILQLRNEWDNIEKLIADIQKRRAYVKMAEAIFDVSIGVASEFVGALKMVSAGKDLIKNLIICAERTMELCKWCDRRRDALSAASLQGFTFQNRIDNLDFQANEATVRAIMKLAELAGGALAVTGMGEAVAKAVSAASALVELALDQYKESELKKAWKAYITALQNPYDRIMMREAITKNTTLAKYAMAYAALKDNDPIAREGLAFAGLTEEVLRNPSANVDKVVQFMEVKWEQDPLNLRRVPVSDWQADKSGALSVAAFLANKNAALTNRAKLVENLMAPLSTGAVEGALRAFEQATTATELAENVLKEAVKKRESDQDKVEKALDNVADFLDLAKDYPTELGKLRSAFRPINLTTLSDLEKVAQLPGHLDKVKSEITVPARQLRNALDPLIEELDACPPLDAYITNTDECIVALTAYPAKLDALEEALTAVSKNLANLKPLKTDGTPNDFVKPYFDGLKLSADAQARDVPKRRKAHAVNKQELVELLAKANKMKTDLPQHKTDFGELKQQAADFLHEVNVHWFDCKMALDKAKQAVGQGEPETATTSS